MFLTSVAEVELGWDPGLSLMASGRQPGPGREEGGVWWGWKSGRVSGKSLQ